MLRTLTAGLVATAALLGATTAQAGTSWSIGINLPPAAVVVSDGPRYYAEPAQVYYAPPPVRYVPAPRYVEREVVYVPPPRVVYERRWDDRRWGERREHWHHDHHEHRWEDRRDDYGPRRGR